MTLPFSLYIDKKPTHFPEKILTGLHDRLIISDEVIDKYNDFLNQIHPEIPVNYLGREKLHTIRDDEKDRWQVGSKIHFVVGNRTKNRYQFAPVLNVKSIQEIFMTYSDLNGLEITIDDEKYLYADDISRLAINDGFDTRYQFQEWFIPFVISKGGSFSGKIIHWTDLKY